MAHRFFSIVTGRCGACRWRVERRRKSTPDRARIAITIMGFRRMESCSRSAISRSSLTNRLSTPFQSLAGHRRASRSDFHRTGTAGRRMARHLLSAVSGTGDFGIFTIPTAGGEETRLTTTRWPSMMGPINSPDGRKATFISIPIALGPMQIWRMRPDGTNAEQNHQR